MIALGVRFDDRVTGKLEAFATHARIIHVDIDPAEIHKNKTAHIPVCSGAWPVAPCRCGAVVVAACVWCCGRDEPSRVCAWACMRQL
jgi:glyoxylate carboligase